MSISEARFYENQNAQITYRNRFGQILTLEANIERLKFVPLYGAIIFAACEQIPLERVTRIEAV